MPVQVHQGWPHQAFRGVVEQAVGLGVVAEQIGHVVDDRVVRLHLLVCRSTAQMLDEVRLQLGHVQQYRIGGLLEHGHDLLLAEPLPLVYRPG